MDLGFLRPLYENSRDGRHDGYVSVYLDTTPTTENADSEVALRWRAARERLAADGAGAVTLDAAQQAVAERPRHARGMAVFASDGAVRLSSALAQAPEQGPVRYAPLPHVVPWLARRPWHVPHVRVAANRAGGTLVTVSGGDTADDTPRTEKTDVPGESWPVHKISTGDWAEWRIQNTAEETWAENAKRIAQAATAAAGKVRAAFVVLGGDVRERSMVLEQLPVALQSNVVIVDREVQPDAPAFEDAARAEVARRADLESDVALEEFAVRMSVTEPGSRRAVEGLDETLTALRDGLASDVLLGGDPVSELTAWIGPGMAEAAAGEEQLVAFGVTDPVPDRADAALARSAAGTGASLHLLRSDSGAARDSGAAWPRDGVGALLRAPIAVL